MQATFPAPFPSIWQSVQITSLCIMQFLWPPVVMSPFVGSDIHWLCTVIRLWIGHRMAGHIFLFFPSVQTGSGAFLAFHSIRKRSKRPGLKADHSTSFSTNVMNDRSCTAVPTYIFTVSTGNRSLLLLLWLADVCYNRFLLTYVAVTMKQFELNLSTL
jgi:hypothetical protein